jgi:signal transduction histidine kinase
MAPMEKIEGWLPQRGQCRSSDNTTALAVSAPAAVLGRRSAASDELSELKAVLARTTHALHSKTKTLAELSHELRGSLAPILAAVELLDGAPPQLQERACDVLRRQTKHLSRLIDDLARMAHDESSTLSLSLERVSLTAIIEQAVELAAPLLQSKKHTVTFELQDGVELHADRGRLVQVFSNLITTAAKYTDTGGMIRIATEPADEVGLVRVIDNGIGIAPDILPRIFDLYVRSARAAMHEGQRLGLAIVRELVQQHDGSVEARSEGPGRGSEFVVRLPCLTQPVA